MKNSIVLGIAIIIGFAVHALIVQSKPVESNLDTSAPPVNQLTEYNAIARLKQSAVDQLSDLKGETISINGQECFYMFIVDENADGDGVRWTHKFFKFRNDSLVKIPTE